ncbi:MAG: prepilin peptidase [Kiritimatiellae bacterium]|nr:prepilin peptidase [Kiritimatiellia bacterium]MDW8457653.1 prepilin peptidase [Verrucomicrobiota bacterium]
MSGAAWTAYFTLLSFFGGACVGSFINVCIHRIPRGESIIRPRSRCPSCGSPIRWYDNIPFVSFLLLRGRCRDCRGRISLRYPFVELLTAVLFLGIWNAYGFDPRTPVYMAAVAALIAASFIDLDFMIIPDRISLGGMVAGLAVSGLLPSLHGKTEWTESLLDSLIGLSAGAGLLFAVALLGKLVFKKDAMGLGDVKLLGAIGALLGWQAILFTIFLSSLLGSAVGVALIASGRSAWQSRIPYGPYLSASAAIWILGGHSWWKAYLEWLLGPAA